MEILIRSFLFLGYALVFCAVARAATLDGVTMPDSRMIDGRAMQLNGIGLRTYSFLGIKIYIAGLYLEQKSDNADGILHSSEQKLLDFRFLRDVSSEDARKAWVEGFNDNCRLPACRLDPADVNRFLAAVPVIRKGDETQLLFNAKGVEVSLNGRPLGIIPDTRFAEVVLATFIGAVPATPRLKTELLGGRE